MSNKMPVQGEFCWNELMTPNAQKASKFYADLLGWKGEEQQVGDKTYTFFKNGDKGVGGMMEIPAAQKADIPPHWMSYIAVDNIDNTVEKAKALGAEIKIASQDVGDFGRFAIIIDPTGAHIAFWQQLSDKECS